ncbi:large subunit ribosomal protein L8e [Enteropsectra breve]|nr:large subunit ribosomal protein L8e [Enteropsectra breve]
MSKVIRKFRQQKKKNRIDRQFTEPKYPTASAATEFKIVDIVHERGKGAPLAVAEMNGEKFHLAATEGIAVGKVFQMGDNVAALKGNVTKLKNIPEGSYVNSVEYVYGDGGRIAINAGGFCTLVNHRKEYNQTVIKMPSGIKKTLSSEVRAVVGIVASAGMAFKPILKAGTAHYLKKSRGQLFPRVRGVAMNPVDHAHGGGNHQHIGFPCTIARTAPYAQQVGLVAARSTGRRTGAKKNK